MKLNRVWNYRLNEGSVWLLKCLAVALPAVLVALILPSSPWFIGAGCVLLACAGTILFSTLIGHQDQIRLERRTTAGVVMTFAGLAIVFW